MSFHTTADTIRVRLQAQWDTLRGDPTDCPIAWQNVVFDPQSDFDPASHVGWVRSSVLWGQARQASISGTNLRWRRPGIVMCQIFTPQGTDDEVALQLADNVSTALQGVTVSGVVLQATSITIVGADDAFYQVNAQTRFRYDS